MSGALDSIFAGIGGLADTLIATYGTTVTISYTTETTYNPTTMTAAASVATSYSAAATPPSPYSVEEINGSSILEGDVTILVPTADTPEKPPMGCTVTLNSEKWRAIRIFDIRSGNDSAVYRMQLRRV